jgi:hypothetical protein
MTAISHQTLTIPTVVSRLSCNRSCSSLYSLCTDRTENTASNSSPFLHARLFRLLPSNGRCLQSHYLATAVLELLISWSLSSNGSTYHNTRRDYKISGLEWKIGFIFKILQINLYPLQCTLHPFTHRCIQIFHCSKRCCRSSADTLFSRSGVFYFTSMTDSDEFLSTHFSLWGTGKSHSGLYPLNKGSGGVQALECIYWLKTASLRGRYELAHCLNTESMISSSTIPVFSSSLILRAWSGPSSSTFD